ncbi:Protein disulfide-isomerase 5-4 [Apostasia shenzhenica]|uniref:Protein disulfide-isomerase 5-4 n=1 Tax=Apostasia shenzhenica TaxID=1088818 RepID=A0A2I0AQW8_9ASPA|nr:Protein disulfide-isomerase 5-4 [Apostasia shenzhenica]
MEVLAKLKDLDAYPKVNEDFYNRTFSGGLITIVSSIAVLFLFLSEIRLYIFSATETKLIVDTSRGERLRVKFDVTFPCLACSLMSVDAMDISGERHYDIRHDIVKTRLDHLGNVIESKQGDIGAPKIERPLQRHGGRLEHNETYCGSCYGAEGDDDHCCNSCEEVREAYRRRGWVISNPDLIDQCKREGYFQKIQEEQGEGCNIHGFVDVSKVAGNIHFAPGKSFQQFNFLFLDLVAFQTEYNVSHKINKLSFGEEFPGVINPLDGARWIQQRSAGMYQYFVKVVPTIYTDIRGHKIYSNQFSVTEHFREGNFYPRPLPGIYIIYDFSPIKVIFTEENKSLVHFLTSICAVVGGVFTVAGIIDAFVFHGHQAIKKKMQLGKYG